MLDPKKLKSISVLFEDEHILAVNKPAGLSVHGGAGEKKKTAIEIIQTAGDQAYQLAHRLDRATSGVLLFTKNPAAQQVLHQNWDSVRKRYLVGFFGLLPSPVEEIRGPLSDKDGRRKDSHTLVTQLATSESFGPLTFAEVVIKTGRKHQIRRHLSGRRLPVIFDDTYGDFRRNKALRKSLQEVACKTGRYFLLHAFSMTLRHPMTHSKLTFSAPLSDHFDRILDACGQRPAVLEKLRCPTNTPPVVTSQSETQTAPHESPDAE